jgi:tRNA G46 methylase TrmB
MPYFSKLLEVLRPEGAITFATNEQFYFDELVEYGVRDWNLNLKGRRTFTRDDLPAPRSHFEKKYLERGEACYEVVFEKAGVIRKLA